MSDLPDLTAYDWRSCADYIKSEFDGRKQRRFEKEQIWDEVDRQLEMEPITSKPAEGSQPDDWYPDLELPFQAQTLEVVLRDARRLIFPRGTRWYETSAYLSDKYAERFKKRRDKIPLIGDEPTPQNLDQETANILVRTAIDHYHRFYDFRGAVQQSLGECIKYGTCVARVKPVQLNSFAFDYRGEFADSVRGPALVPVHIREVYLDDSATQTRHEGIDLRPVTMRHNYKHIDDLKRAAAAGKPERGWLSMGINTLKPMGEGVFKDHVEIIEAEGDIVILGSRKNVYLPNVTVTVACGTNSRVVRFQTNPYPFPSYLTGWYLKDDLRCPYGISPLMKGQPIQEAMASVMNDFLASAALKARPPVTYDRNDPQIQAEGGPRIHPGAQWGADSPNSIEVHNDIGDVAGLGAAYQGLVKQYEDLTGVNDPRRGAQTVSHTTAFAKDIENTRGLARTDGFTIDFELSFLAPCLYMEYAIIKKVMTTPQPVSVGHGGIEGWIELASEDLPDRADFTITGSAGVLDEREQYQQFLAATQFAAQMATFAAQMGQKIDLDFNKMIIEAYHRAGIHDAEKFVGRASGIAQGAAQGQPGIPGTPEQLPPQLQAILQGQSAA